jgi:glycerol-3-phosphate dehydrogenase (NAD(P)+)
MEKRATVLGAGAWGTAISNLLAENGCDVTLWSYEPELTTEINNQKTNSRYLPDLKLAHNIIATSDIGQAFNFSSIIVEAIPVKHFRNVLDLAKPHISKNHSWVMTSKGFELETFLLPSEVLESTLEFQPQIAALSGPNFARELIKKSISASVLASQNNDFAKQVAAIFENDFLKIYFSQDLKGVQAGGALKNVYALTLGIMRGQEYSENTIAFIFTKSLEEMTKVAIQIGGSKETIYSLAGLGDLFLTGNCAMSKNFKCGKMLGQGIALADIGKKFEVLPEGINTIKSLVLFAQKHNSNLPICSGTYDFIFEGKSIKSMLHRLTA